MVLGQFRGISITRRAGIKPEMAHFNYPQGSSGTFFTENGAFQLRAGKLLQPQEFLELLTRCGLRFPAEVVLDIFLKADANEDGVIEYDEFIPAMKAIIAGAKEAQPGVAAKRAPARSAPAARSQQC